MRDHHSVRMRGALACMVFLVAGLVLSDKAGAASKNAEVLPLIVRGADGKPVADALIAVFSQTGEHSVVQSDGDGRFSMEVAPGAYQLGASGTAGVGGAPPLSLAAGDNDPIEVTLAPGTQTLTGKVTDQQGRGHGGVLAVVGTSDERVYPTRTADDGTWSLTIPPAEQYMAVLQSPGGQRVMAMIEDPNATIESTLNRDGAAPAAAIEWIRKHHVPLSTVEAGQGLDDMAALDSMFAEATVVGLGETTHGTREFFQMKHRMLEYLVERHGFTVFGIEANRTECRAINDYIQTGNGDPKEALAGIYFWTWNTHEVLDLIEWMRAYNASHPKKLQFVGFDAQTPDVAARNVDAFLAKVDASAPERAAVALFGQPWNAERFAALSKKEQAATVTALDQLAQRFEDNKKAWTTATSADDFADAREDLTVVRQVQLQRAAPGMESFSVRDRAMADNVLLMHMDGRGVWSDGTDVLDASGAGSHGTVISDGGPIELTDGVFGTAIDDHLASRISIPTDGADGLWFGEGDFTWSLWFRMDNACQQNHVYMGVDNNQDSGDLWPHLWLGCTDDQWEECSGTVDAPRGGGVLRSQHSTSGDGAFYCSDSAIDDGLWHHIAVTKQGHLDSTVRLYLDGQLEYEGAGSFAGPIEYPDAPDFTIGAFSRGTYPSEGVFDEAAIWSRSLSSQEIIAVYARGALSLSVSVRVCDEPECADEPAFATAYLDPAEALAPGSELPLSLSPGRYVQYQVRMARPAAGNTLGPALRQVTLRGMI